MRIALVSDAGTPASESVEPDSSEASGAEA